MPAHQAGLDAADQFDSARLQHKPIRQICALPRRPLAKGNCGFEAGFSIGRQGMRQPGLLPAKAALTASDFAPIKSGLNPGVRLTGGKLRVLTRRGLIWMLFCNERLYAAQEVRIVCGQFDKPIAGFVRFRFALMRPARAQDEGVAFLVRNEQAIAFLDIPIERAGEGSASERIAYARRDLASIPLYFQFVVCQQTY